jgi:iron complex outermembrane receptor protein
VINIHKWMSLAARALIVTALACAISGQLRCQNPSPPGPSQSGTGDLSNLTIEDLMNLEVTSGAKKEEPVQLTAAAIFVITSEDFRRSGATTLPDVLRMVPGLDVAQISANSWAVSSRGFNDAFANKMLVLVDGRTVYSAGFSGVFWDAQDLLLADVERIEVIRGPGAALWGTNAVNGVINIITKTAEKTQGGLVTAAGGNVEGGYGAGQYGGQIGGDGFYRIFAKGFSKDSVPGPPGLGPQDGWTVEHGGFRADWVLNSRDSLTVQGDLFRSSGQGATTFTTSLTPLVFGPVPGSLTNSGGNLLVHWRRTFSPRSEISLIAYYDRVATNAGFIKGSVGTANVEFQHHFASGERNDFVWGAGYREVEVNSIGSVAVSFTPPHTSENLLSAFIQDQVEIIPGRLRLTVGDRIEYDYTSDFNNQPDARLLWTPSTRQAIWLAVSRSLRAVSPTDVGVESALGPSVGPGGLLIVPEVMGNRLIRPEEEVTFQAGYRRVITSNLSVDGTAYFNHYSGLVGQDEGTPVFVPGPGIPYLLVPETFDNKISGQTHGIEFSGTWKPLSIWKLTGGYTWLDAALHDNSTGAPPNTTAANLQSPHHQFSIRSNLDLPHRIEFDSALYRVGPLDATTEPGVPGYYRLDARIGWSIGEHAEFAVVGQNLLSANHLESPSEPDWFAAVAVRRSFYAKMTWHFQGSQKK